MRGEVEAVCPAHGFGLAVERVFAEAMLLDFAMGSDYAIMSALPRNREAEEGESTYDSRLKHQSHGSSSRLWFLLARSKMNRE